MQLSTEKQYSRKENIIYEEGVAVVKLKQGNKYLNYKNLSKEGIEYLNRYMEMYTDLVEIIVEKSEKKNEQISLF